MSALFIFFVSQLVVRSVLLGKFKLNIFWRYMKSFLKIL